MKYRATPSKFLKVIRFLHSRRVRVSDSHEAMLPPNARATLFPKEQANLLTSQYAAISLLLSCGSTFIRRRDVNEDLDSQFIIAQIIVVVWNLRLFGADGRMVSLMPALSTSNLTAYVPFACIYNQSIRLYDILSLVTLEYYPIL